MGKDWTVRDQAAVSARIHGSFREQRMAAWRREHRKGSAEPMQIERGAPGTCQRLVPGENGQRECGEPATWEYVSGPRCLRFCDDCAPHVPAKYALRPIKDY